MPDPLLITKLRPPPARTQHLLRGRLLTLLEQGMQKRLVLLSAPAGYGKTTLLGSWLERTEADVAWLSLDEDDNSAERFLRHLVASLQQVDDTLAALGDVASKGLSAALTTVLNDVAENQSALALVLEDFHHVADPEVLEAVRYLVENAPPAFHLIISTRSDPPLPLALLRGRGDLLEIRAEELRFTPAEVGDLLERMELSLSTGDSEKLALRTEGWAAGLHLAALSLRGRQDVSDFIDLFTGTDRFVLDYLMEEVLMRQPPEVQDFLILTSILDRFGSDLAAAVAQHDEAGAMLLTLERDNLFLIPLDTRRQWYRYHAFFRDLLRQRLQDLRPNLVPELHARASAWFETEGKIADAVRHALQGADFGRAAALIEANPQAAAIRHALLEYLQGGETDRPLENLLERAVAQGVPLGQRSRLLDAFEKPAASEVDYGWLEPLSERELEVLRLAAAGLTNKQIARRLDISLNTVKTHTKNAYSKLNVGNRSEAASKARELGLL